MEWSPTVVWTCLLGAGLALALSPALSTTTSKAFPQPPRLIGCVFMYRGNATCHWEPGDLPATNYTLNIQRKAGSESSLLKSSLKMLTCTTPETSCTVEITTSRVNCCITVTAHSGSRDISSQPRCQSAKIEVILPPVILESVKPAREAPQCLNIKWSRSLSNFVVTTSEIEAGDLNSQLEIKAQGQPDQVKNVTVTGYTILACLFRPDTSYIIRLRHRYRGPASPWSPWSNARPGRTGESAPSAAPQFWRQVKEAGRNGWRLITLLWKPLPDFLANGRVRFYNVTCQTDDAEVLSDRGSCRELDHTSTSCSLPLPAGRCSCALTASTSAGKSPEARLWLPGASETELPSTGPITVRALNDSSFEVSWTAPVSRSVSSFVVEWFAVREKNSSVLHWEKLNSSSTTLVVTEGVKPMERYAVSVRALYGEQGAGKNSLDHIYTRQGTPSAGPDVKAHQISNGMVELSWSPVPVELLRGFVRNYTLKYTAKNQPPSSVFVPGNDRRYTLKNLSLGHYTIYMQAVTDAGTGAAGTPANVHIGSEEISIVTYVVVLLVLTSLVLVLMACLAQNKMVKQKLCRDVPNPSNSSLSHWAPKTTLECVKQLVVPEEPDITYSEVISLGELQNPDPDQDRSYQSYRDVQTHSSHQSSLVPVKIPEMTLIRTKAKTTSVTDRTACPSIYSTVSSQPLQNFPLLHPTYQKSTDWQRSTGSVNDGKLQLGGASEPSEPHLAPAAEQKMFFLQQHQGPVSPSNFSSVSHPSVLLSQLAEVTSPKHPFTQSSFNSALSLQPNTFTHPTPLSDSFPSSSPPFHHSVLVDFSYCPVEYDPYIPSDV